MMRRPTPIRSARNMCTVHVSPRADEFSSRPTSDDANRRRPNQALRDGSRSRLMPRKSTMISSTYQRPSDHVTGPVLPSNASSNTYGRRSVVGCPVS